VSDYLILILDKLSGVYFAPVMGIVYICCKLVIRHILHKFAEHEYDFWGTMAWFGVDIILLSSSVCVAAKVHARTSNNYATQVLFYISLIMCFFLSCTFYTFFTKRRKSLTGLRPYKDPGLFFYMCAIWFLGFLWFWNTIDLLKVPLPGS
jgi:hypothetical protein